MAIERWVDLSGLPKKMWAGRECIDWECVNNHKAPFLYGGESGVLTVTHMQSYEKYSILQVEFEGNSIEMRSGQLKNGGIGKILKAKNWNEKATEENWLYSEIHLHKYLKNPEEAKSFRKYSNKKINCVCPNCNKEKKMMINNLVLRGFSCQHCKTGLSFPEKLLDSLLELNDIEFEKEKRYEELGNYRYDFYLPEYNLIIETHGEQHYRQSTGSFSNLLKVQESDLVKKQFCESKNIDYIAIDCRKSEISFILDNINSFEKLKELLPSQNLEDIQESIVQKSKYKNIKEILRDRKLGMTYSDLGKKYGYTDNVAYSIVKRNSIA